MGTPELPVPDGLVLRPFRGVRFAVDDPAKVTSPPYDLISEGDVQALLDSHPNNVVRLILPRPPAAHRGTAQGDEPAEDAPRTSQPEGAEAHAAEPAEPEPLAVESVEHYLATTSEPADRQTGAVVRFPTFPAEDRTDGEIPGQSLESGQPLKYAQPHEYAQPHPHTDTQPHPGTQAHPGTQPHPATQPHPDAQLHTDAQARADAQAAGVSGQPVESTQPGDTAPPGTSVQPGTGAQPGTGGGLRETGAGEGPGESARREAVGSERYGQARDALRTWLAAGVLVRDEIPALYVYEQSGPGVLQRGLIGDVGLAAPEQRIVLPHENVMPGPVADRLALMSTTQANLEPIFLLYNGTDFAKAATPAPSTPPRRGAASLLVDEVASTRPPLVEAHTDDGVRHRLWAVTDQAEIDAVNADLRHRQALIADGHHRYATYRELQRQEHARHTPAGAPSPEGAAEAPSPEAGPPNPESAAERPSPEGAAEAARTADGAETPQGDADVSRSTQDTLAPGRGAAVSWPARDAQAHEGGTLMSAGDTWADEGGALASTGGARVADGGAGAAEGVPVGPWDFGLALLVDSNAYPPDLKAIHRVIPGLPLEEAAARAKGAWRVQEFAGLDAGLAALREAGEPAFLLAGAGACHLLTDPDPTQLAYAMPAERSERWNRLNTSVLTEFVLPKVWGMRDDERSVRIVHHDAQAAADLAATTGGTAVILNPLAVEDVLAVAAGGERVPRKSTSFGPKPRTGLVLRTFAIE